MEACDGGSQEPAPQHTIALRMVCATPTLTFRVIALGAKMGGVQRRARAIGFL